LPLSPAGENLLLLPDGVKQSTTCTAKYYSSWLFLFLDPQSLLCSFRARPHLHKLVNVCSTAHAILVSIVSY
jgi:hypothetical protein